MKCGHGFGDHSQDGELARWGLGRDTKWRSYYAQKRSRNAKPGNHLKELVVDKSDTVALQIQKSVITSSLNIARRFKLLK